MEQISEVVTHQYEIRPIDTAAQDAELLSLLNRAFPVPSGGSFYDDFPVWNPGFKLNTKKFGAYSGDRLIASASARIAALKSTRGPHAIGIVGCVVTEPDFRGHGLATQMALKASDWIEAQGAHAAILWGSESALYERIGFRVFGEQVRLPLDELRWSGARVAVTGGWTPKLFDLLRARAGGLALDIKDAFWISAHKNVQWLWTGPAERPTAFVALGRGIDLGGIIHEWGGSIQDLNSILQQLHQIQPGLSLLLSPSQIGRFHLQSPNAVNESLCMVKEFEGKPKLPTDTWFWGLDGA